MKFWLRTLLGAIVVVGIAIGGLLLRLLGPNGYDRVDGDKLCALLVGPGREP